MDSSDLIEVQQKWGGTIRSYLFGLLLSILLTVGAYFTIVGNLWARWTVTSVVVGLGVFQMLVQMRFFLHLGKESRPRWKLLVFAFMLLLLGILVGGSLWIMYNLDKRVMPQMQQVGPNPRISE